MSEVDMSSHSMRRLVNSLQFTRQELAIAGKSSSEFIALATADPYRHKIFRDWIDDKMVDPDLEMDLGL